MCSLITHLRPISYLPNIVVGKQTTTEYLLYDLELIHQQIRTSIYLLRLYIVRLTINHLRNFC